MMPYNISLQQIRYFLTASEFQNISQAAEYMHTSQSTISKSIAPAGKESGGFPFSAGKRKSFT